MKEKTLIENIIELRQKYKNEYEAASNNSVNSIKKQLLARFVNDLTDLLCSKGQEGKIS